MSKKQQTEQKIILSIIAVTLLSLASTLFYIIDDSISNDDIHDQIEIVEPSYSEDEIYQEENISNIDIASNSQYLSEIQDLYNSLKEDLKDDEIEEIEEIPPSPPPPKEPEQEQPKLAIIIDDVAYDYQVKNIKALHLPLTISFFPADINHPNTPKYAKNEEVFMIHFPLEAIHFPREEIDTLHVVDSRKRIAKRVRQIVRQFPSLRYTNNHTGSKFTADYRSMKILLENLHKHNIQFIDSLTTSKSVVKRVSRELGLRYIRRDIFLDNKLDVQYITGQIRKAIAIAKKRGYAIAIGHPHKATLKALSQIRPLLGDVKLVRIDEI